VGAACPVRWSPGYKLLQSVSLWHSIQYCLRPDWSQSVSNNKSIHFISYNTWRCLSLQYFDLRYSYLNLKHVKHVICKSCNNVSFNKNFVSCDFFLPSVYEPFATNISFVIGVQPKAEITKGSFFVYAERVPEDTGRSTVKNYSSS
jgi:hypothetical protein